GWSYPWKSCSCLTVRVVVYSVISPNPYHQWHRPLAAIDESTKTSLPRLESYPKQRENPLSALPRIRGPNLPSRTQRPRALRHALPSSSFCPTASSSTCFSLV